MTHPRWRVGVISYCSLCYCGREAQQRGEFLSSHVVSSWSYLFKKFMLAWIISTLWCSERLPEPTLTCLKKLWTLFRSRALLKWATAAAISRPMVNVPRPNVVSMAFQRVCSWRHTSSEPTGLRDTLSTTVRMSCTRMWFCSSARSKYLCRSMKDRRLINTVVPFDEHPIRISLEQGPPTIHRPKAATT